MYNHLLVPVVVDHDRAGKSLQVAAALASPGAVITVFHAVEPIPTWVEGQVPASLIASGHQQLKEQLQAIADSGPEGTRLVVVTGHPGRSIDDYAKENDVDCIVLYSHMPGLEHFFLGSTATHVVRHAQCAVHVLR